jgi:hypothetical protein
MKRLILAVAISSTLVGAIGHGTAFARKDPPCTVNPNQVAVGQTYTVSVSGLPTNSPIYLWTTNVKYATISSTLLGTTATGSFNLSESAATAGMWSYQFTGPTKSSGTVVYATCAVTVG